MNDSTLDAVTLPSGDIVTAKPMTVGALRQAMKDSRDAKNKQDDTKLTDLVIAGTIMMEDGISPRFGSIEDILDVPQPDFMKLQELALKANGMGSGDEDQGGN